MRLTFGIAMLVFAVGASSLFAGCKPAEAPSPNLDDLKRDYVELCNHQALVMGAEMVQSGRISGEEAMAYLSQCDQKEAALREAGLTAQEVIALANQDRP